MRILFFLFLYVISTATHAQQITGSILDAETKQPIEYVNIYNVQSKKGTVSNTEGFFELNASLGDTLEISFLGYRSQHVVIDKNIQKQGLTIRMESDALMMHEIVLEADRVNLGKDIIKKLIANKSNRALPNEQSCKIYRQTTMKRVFQVERLDSLKQDSSMIQIDSIGVVYLNERASTLYKRKSQLKEIVHAEIKQTGDDNLKRYGSMRNNRDFKGSGRLVSYNPVEFFRTVQDFEIDFYNNYLNNKSISDRPITSPIASTALANYNYKLKHMDIGVKDTLFTIDVEPKYKGAPLWSGKLYVQSSDYQLYKAEMNLDPDLNNFDSLQIRLVYNHVDGMHMVQERGIQYKAKISGNNYQIDVKHRSTDFDFNTNLAKNFFSSEQVRFEESSLKSDSDLMLKYRGVALEKDLKVFFSEQDSIYRSLNSDEYLAKQDSIFNSITWRKIFLSGFGFRKRSIGLTTRFNGVMESFRIFGVDGFRISPGGSFTKEFLNSDVVSVEYDIDYGLSNGDIKGAVNVSYVFLPQKFARVYGGIGNQFAFISTKQSLDAIISRSNFIQNKFVRGGYSMELVNGLYMNTKVEYSDKQSVINLKVNKLSEFLFGKQNFAADFERYRIFTFEADLIYEFGQKYVTRGRKKIVLPNYNPKLKLHYRKGIPGINDSEVDFDYFEVELKQKLPSTKLGSLNWLIKAGEYFNKKSLRQLEYNYFRGSTRYIFTNPLQDLLQIGKTRITPARFFKASAIHHFDGFFLDKIPFINRLQMELLAGVGSLIIPEENLYHGEFYVGIGKKFKLWGETVQIAGYAVTSDNNLDKANIEFKVGLNFYNAFAREWVY